MELVSKRGNFSKSEGKWDLEYFCEIEMILRLRQKLGLSLKIFRGIEVGLRIFLSEGKRGEIGKFLSKREMDLK